MHMCSPGRSEARCLHTRTGGQHTTLPRTCIRSPAAVLLTSGAACADFLMRLVGRLSAASSLPAACTGAALGQTDGPPTAAETAVCMRSPLGTQHQSLAPRERQKGQVVHLQGLSLGGLGGASF